MWKSHFYLLSALCFVVLTSSGCGKKEAVESDEQRQQREFLQMRTEVLQGLKLTSDDASLEELETATSNHLGFKTASLKARIQRLYQLYEITYDENTALIEQIDILERHLSVTVPQATETSLLERIDELEKSFQGLPQGKQDFMRIRRLHRLLFPSPTADTSAP